VVDDFVVHVSSPINETKIELPHYGLSEALLISGHFDSCKSTYPYGEKLDTISSKEMQITAIPYARWGNRTKGGMRVWIPQTD
jgi:hypothetical protein